MNCCQRRARIASFLNLAIITVMLYAATAAASAVEVRVKGRLDILRHDISLRIHPAIHLLESSDYITIRAATSGMYAFLIGSNFTIDRLYLDGKKILYDEISQEKLAGYQNIFDVDEDFFTGAKGFRFHVPDKYKHILEIHFHGTVYDTLQVSENFEGVSAEETTGIIGNEGVFLSPETHWYPDQPNEYAAFSVKVVTPIGWEAVTQGRLVGKSENADKVSTEWDVSFPSKGLYLIAGNYIVKEFDSEGVRIMGYFFSSEEDLMDDYLRASARHISLYNKLIGPYPFSKFAVVQNFFPAGHGMPSYTVLGRSGNQLPSITDASLGHEVAHNWWGNCVYVDYGDGNWCEGLAAYFADYRYKQAISDSAAFEYRRTINIEFTTYVGEDNDFPLSEFEEGTTPVSRAIGYGKCAMVFHMLKRWVGEEAFYRTLRRFYRDFRFKEASWQDMQNTFERVSGSDLGTFFDQWVNAPGAPHLVLENASLEAVDDQYRIQVELSQEPAYRLIVPIYIHGADTNYVTNASIASPTDTIDFLVGFQPLRLSVDPRHEVFRRLGPLEIPPTISGVLGDKEAIVVLPSMVDGDKRNALIRLSRRLSGSGAAQVLADTMVTAAEIARGTLIILGGAAENAAHQWVELPGGVITEAHCFSVGGQDYSEAGNSAVITFKNPMNGAASICVVLGNSAESVGQSADKIIDYGKYSYVTFADGEKVQAGMLPVENGPLTAGFASVVDRR